MILPLRQAFRIFPLLALLLFTGGCGLVFGRPPAINIQLRKDKDALRKSVEDLQRQLAAKEAEVKALREKTSPLPTLSHDRLTRLFTTHSLKLGRQTGGWDRDPHSPGDEGLVVHVSPLDEEGQALKAAGAFTIEAFDLADAAEPLVGRWEFDLQAARKSWRGNFLDYNYVLECPWQQKPPSHAELTLKVTFLDDLTQTPFHAQQVVKVNLPGSTQPVTTQPAATQPATRPGGATRGPLSGALDAPRARAIDRPS
jgi:hypothetical protein